MLATEKQITLNALLSDVSRDELVWINGYISGVLSGKEQSSLSHKGSPDRSLFGGKITLAFGTETGNAKSLASRLTTIARKQGIAIKAVALEQYRLANLSKEDYFIVLISTQGDGEPPLTAKKFYDFIHKENPSLSNVKYAVFALGDSSYPLFCQTGVDVDAQLSRLGAQRLMDLTKCDTDYEAPGLQWFETLLHQLQGATNGEQKQVVVSARQGNRNLSYTGTILSNTNLNDKGSDKQTHHIEISVEGLSYLPGDALSILPRNPLPVVQDIITLTGIPADQKIIYREAEYEITDLLENKLNIVRLAERTVRQYAKIVSQDIPEARISFLDLLKIYPVKDTVQFLEAIAALDPLTPRQYSIASAPQSHDGEVHLTVARDTFFVNEIQQYGLCSDCLTQLPEGTTLRFSVHPNHRFRLPKQEKDIIMVGPGTGIAPFRSFLWEREAALATGRNWLFFGDRRFTTDFLYQTEIQNWIATGLLTRFNAAFSRDQKEKLYVQHKMEAHGAALWQWLDNGAYFYLCGAKDPMSKDVEETLLRIIQKYGGKPDTEALQYLEQLSEEGRYLKDVY